MLKDLNWNDLNGQENVKTGCSEGNPFLKKTIIIYLFNLKYGQKQQVDELFINQLVNRNLVELTSDISSTLKLTP